MIHILLVDDHHLVRAGITQLLALIPDMKVVGDAESGEEALQRIKEKDPDIVLMDLKMPGMGGLEATRKCVRLYPNVKIIALTACVEEPLPTKVLQAGAKGYLSKSIRAEELVQAIRMVHAGKPYIDPFVAQRMALSAVHNRANPASSSISESFKELSHREMEVLLKISHGDSVQDISKQLFLSPKTVNSYRYRLFKKLNLKSNVDLAHIAMRYGLLNREFV